MRPQEAQLLHARKSVHQNAAQVPGVPGEATSGPLLWLQRANSLLAEAQSLAHWGSNGASKSMEPRTSSEQGLGPELEHHRAGKGGKPAGLGYVKETP